MADVAGTCRYLCSPELRAIVRANVRVALGPGAQARDTNAHVRAIYRGFARSVVDFLRLPDLAPSALRARVRVDGEEVLHDALARGRGVVVVSAHVGCWEVGGAYLASLGAPVHVVARAHAATGVERFFAARRRALGLHVVEAGAPVGGLLRALRRGEVVALLADRPASDAELRVPFCGRPAPLPRGHVVLALRTGAALLAAVTVRVDHGYRIRWQPVSLAGLRANGEGIDQGVCRAAVVLESFVRAHLRQWHAFAPVWPAVSPPPRVAVPPVSLAWKATERTPA